jgi:flavin-dependent dehydrogenase
MDLRLTADAIAQEVRGTATFIQGDLAGTRRNPGCILNREVADALLADRAVEAGAVLRTCTKATSLTESVDGAIKVVLRTRGPDAETSVVTTSLVIGADGPRSMVGDCVGELNTRTVTAHQVTADLRGPGTDTEVYLHPTYRGGYAWLFPKGDRANVGVGVDPAMGGRPREALAHFINFLGGRIGKVQESTGGLIPVNGPMRTIHGSLVQAGDAAGHTHSITGGGIHQAAEAGRLAGAAAASRHAGNEGALKTYEEEFDSLFSLHLRRAADRRIEMEAGWAAAESDASAFQRLMRRGWIGFPEYYKERPRMEG